MRIALLAAVTTKGTTQGQRRRRRQRRAPPEPRRPRPKNAAASRFCSFRTNSSSSSRPRRGKVEHRNRLGLHRSVNCGRARQLGHSVGVHLPDSAERPNRGGDHRRHRALLQSRSHSLFPVTPTLHPYQQVAHFEAKIPLEPGNGQVARPHLRLSSSPRSTSASSSSSSVLKEEKGEGEGKKRRRRKKKKQKGKEKEEEERRRRRQREKEK